MFGSVSIEGIAFDAEAVISQFMADPGCASLELPRLLTAEQRKHAKKVADQYHDLRCESYGFGADRQLHLFKETGACSSPSPEESSRSTAVLSGTSTSSGAGSGQSAPEQGGHDRPALSDDVQVRRTFIHFDEGATADERVVQSMPHGMFRQRLQAEAAAAVGKEAMEEVVVASASAAPVEMEARRENQLNLDELAPGSTVVITGLVKAPAFNGRTGQVQALEQESGRYSVILSSATGGSQTAKIKRENLTRLCQPPAYSPVKGCFAPALEFEACGSPCRGFHNQMPESPMWEMYSPGPR
jgi:hypothetical protein